MRSFIPSFAILLAVNLIIGFNCQMARADTVRKPVRAGSFYPADPTELSQMIDRLTRKARKTRIRTPADKSLISIQVGRPPTPQLC